MMDSFSDLGKTLLAIREELTAIRGLLERAEAGSSVPGGAREGAHSPGAEAARLGEPAALPPALSAATPTSDKEKSAADDQTVVDDEKMEELLAGFTLSDLPLEMVEEKKPAMEEKIDEEEEFLDEPPAAAKKEEKIDEAEEFLDEPPAAAKKEEKIDEEEEFLDEPPASAKKEEKIDEEEEFLDEPPAIAKISLAEEKEEFTDKAPDDTKEASLDEGIAALLEMAGAPVPEAPPSAPGKKADEPGALVTGFDLDSLLSGLEDADSPKKDSAEELEDLPEPDSLVEGAPDELSAPSLEKSAPPPKRDDDSSDIDSADLLSLLQKEAADKEAGLLPDDDEEIPVRVQKREEKPLGKNGARNAKKIEESPDSGGKFDLSNDELEDLLAPDK